MAELLDVKFTVLALVSMVMRYRASDVSSEHNESPCDFHYWTPLAVTSGCLPAMPP